MSRLFSKNIQFLSRIPETGNNIPTVIDPDNPSLNEAIEVALYFGESLDTLVNIDLEIRNRPTRKGIKLLIMDVDGVLTDGGMFFSEEGDQLKKFNTKDGRGVIDLAKAGFKTGIISHSANFKLISARAKRMQVPLVYAGDGSKLSILKAWCENLDISLNQVAYIGDDINDLSVMEAVGLTACPFDAHKKVKAVADIVLNKKGGQGCVREFIDDYLVLD